MALQYASVGAGLYDGKVKVADGTLYELHAVVSAVGEPAQDEVEVKGDDELLATFISNIREELTISANGVSFDTVQAITGNTAESSAEGLEIPLGTASQQNPPLVEVQAFTRAKDSAGTAVVIEKIWHKVTIKSVKITQEGEAEFNVELTGVAYQTDEDVMGTALDPKRVATLKVIYS